MGVATAWTGIGAVTGGVVTVHGLDGLSAGLTQLITGKETRSYSEQGLSKALQKPGVSKENADIYAAYGNDALSMALTGGAGKLMKFIKAPVKAIPKAKVVPKVNNVAAKGGFDAVGAFKNAISPFKGGNLTNAGRAVTKHPGYFGFESTEALMGAYRTPGALNNLGSTTLKDILRNGVRTTGAGGRYPNGWTTYTLPNGNAASWGLDGTFIGFRGIK